ncbi:MAG: type II toxin-antitoxin system RelB/DinJ family antitoxin [Selenomonadaceae bacterium]|nr:type II toxin-antitoxin system RelB/DinJ family antitoxin [Selenomonadaceae bacterium]
MAKTDTITLRVDPDLKHEAEELCEEMGLTLSAAYTMFLKAVVRTRSIPFKICVSKDPFWSEKNQKHLIESIQELDAGRGKEHELLDA